MSTPYTRSKAKMEKEGWRTARVEQWVPVPSHPAGGIRRDYFGFGDMIAKKRGEKTVIVQTTSAANMGARVTKILTECREDALLCLDTGDRIVVHGWRKGGPRGKRKLWMVNERELSWIDFGIARGFGVPVDLA